MGGNIMLIARRTVLRAGTATAATIAAGPVLARDWGNPPPVRYPDDSVEVLDPSFAKYRVGNANVERLATGLRWAEGPVYFRDGGYLVWSDIPNNRLMRWTEETGAVSIFRPVSNYTNGNTRDRQGRLISCEHGGRRVSRTEYDGTITVLLDRFEGKRLNAPNDAVVHSDGGSGSPIPATASWAITRAARRSSSFRPMSTGSIRALAKRPSW